MELRFWKNSSRISNSFTVFGVKFPRFYKQFDTNTLLLQVKEDGLNNVQTHVGILFISTCSQPWTEPETQYIPVGARGSKLVLPLDGIKGV